MTQVSDRQVSTLRMSLGTFRDPEATDTSPWSGTSSPAGLGQGSEAAAVLEENAAGRIVRVNHVFCRIFGLPGPEALSGSVSPARGWLGPAEVEEPSQHAARVADLVSRGVPVFDERILLRDGRVLRRDFVPIGADQARAGHLWIFRIEPKSALSPRARRITTPVDLALRGEALDGDDPESQRRAQERMLHAGKMAAVGTLVAGLSHELNNPIGVILGYVQGLLRRTPDDAPSRASLVAIERQAQRCAHLVRSLLDFSRQRRAIREPRSLRDLVARACELAEGHARRFQVSFRVDLGENDLVLDTCPAEIESALVNLLTNAIDVSPAGGAVSIAARPASRGARAGVDVSVTDRGAGIAPDVLPHIFDPFFTTKPTGQGTGIGLPLSRQIAESHDGTLDVETQLGSGTTMHLWLPLSAGPCP